MPIVLRSSDAIDNKNYLTHFGIGTMEGRYGFRRLNSHLILYVINVILSIIN